MTRKRRGFLLAMAFLVLATPGAVFFVREEGGLGFMMFRLEKWVKGLSGDKGSGLFEGKSSLTPEEEAVAKRKAARIRKLILAECPNLQVEDKQVDPEQNGYWEMIDFAEDPRLGQFRKLAITNQIYEDKIEPEEIRKELDAFQELGKEIERIAALPERSSMRLGKTHRELILAGEVKAMGDYLLLNARLAALEGDEQESFRCFSLAVNLTEHLGDIETPNFLSDTVRIILRMGLRVALCERILPSLGKSADLEKWNSILGPQIDPPQRYAQLHRGEWSYFSENFTHLLFGEMPDPEQTAIAHARWVEASADRSGKMALPKWGVAKELPHAPFTKELSREGIALFEIMGLNGKMWRKGFIRSAVVEHHFAAAMDLLIREQKGEDLSLLTETFLPNPYTGKPFRYDPATRTLDAVQEADGGDIKALKLPW